MDKKNMLNYIKNYKWRSVFFSYFFRVLIAILILFLPYNLLMYGYYNFTITKEATTFAEQNLLKTASTIDGVLTEIDKYHNTISYNSYTNTFVNRSSIPLEGKISFDILSPVQEQLTKYITVSQYQKAAYIYSLKNNYVLSNTIGGDISNFKNQLWFRHFTETGNDTFRIIDKESSANDLIISKAIMDTNGKTIGLFVVVTDMAKIDGMIKINESELQILETDGSLLYSTNKQSENRYQPETTNLSRDKYATEIKDGKIYTSILSDNLLVYTVFFPMQYFRKNLYGMGILILFGSIGALILVFLISFYVTSKMYTSIVGIISLLQTHAGENVTNEGFNETLFISKNILNIIENNKKIEEELSKRLQLLKKAQSIALQTQINPHFLFNTLQMVNLFVIKSLKGDNEATKIITLLSELLRITLNTKQNIIPLATEIEHAKKYIQIQNIRYKNRFDIHWNISPEAIGSNTIKLILQPVLENAITHGIVRLKDRIGRLDIAIWIDEKKLYLKVEDNGIGMDSDQLKCVIERLNSQDVVENVHIGLANVHQRIQLIYGNEYGVTIQSEQNIGTCVQITTPLI